MGWMIAMAVALALVLVAIYLLAKSGRYSSSSTSGKSQLPAATRPVAARLLAKEILVCVIELRAADAQWDTIFLRLNPNADPDVQRLLIQIRGPHLFNPNCGLGVIEDGCKRILALSPDADSVDALSEAIHRSRPFVR